MSLINDALKRAQRTTQDGALPRPDELELSPIEPSTPAGDDHGRGTGAKRVLWLIVLLVIVCNLVLWIIYKDRRQEAEVAARSADEGAPAAVTEAASETAGARATAPAAIDNLSSSDGASITDSLPVERPVFVLSTIVSHPTRPSAMINQRVLFVGDRVEGYTVTAIRNDDVILTLGEDELVLSLP